jgi:glycosyltransferase involved in cell wall biosynthesis
MPALRDKNILIVSPQSWGIMFLAKHHYAVALAKRGNKVFFLNPPEQYKTKQKRIIDITSSGIDNLWLINHRLSFPYNLKFHAIGLFHFFMRFHVKKILQKINDPIDVVWSFDIGNLYPFRFFGAKPIKIFHPVDEPLNKAAIDSVAGCQIIFSVTKEILEKYQSLAAPKYFINHGVSDFFLSNDTYVKAGDEIQIGLSGNFLRPDIDWLILLEIIKENQNVTFNFWGNVEASANLSGSENDETKSVIAQLKRNKNIKLHGPVNPETLAKQIRGMDGFLICYDIQKDQSKGTNYHKIMEYISTGKVIISNNVSTYQNQPEYVQMTEERNNNNNLPDLFKKVIFNLKKYNSQELQDKRKQFAASNTYAKHVIDIENILDQLSVSN